MRLQQNGDATNVIVGGGGGGGHLDMSIKIVPTSFRNETLFQMRQLTKLRDGSYTIEILLFACLHIFL